MGWWVGGFFCSSFLFVPRLAALSARARVWAFFFRGGLAFFGVLCYHLVVGVGWWWFGWVVGLLVFCSGGVFRVGGFCVRSRFAFWGSLVVVCSWSACRVASWRSAPAVPFWCWFVFAVAFCVGLCFWVWFVFVFSVRCCVGVFWFVVFVFVPFAFCGRVFFVVRSSCSARRVRFVSASVFVSWSCVRCSVFVCSCVFVLVFWVFVGVPPFSGGSSLARVFVLCPFGGFFLCWGRGRRGGGGGGFVAAAAAAGGLLRRRRRRDKKKTVQGTDLVRRRGGRRRGVNLPNKNQIPNQAPVLR